MPFGCVSPRSGGGRNRCANVAAGSRGAALSETAAVAPKVTWLIAATCAHCRRSIRLGHWALGWGEAIFAEPQRRMNPHVGVRVAFSPGCNETRCTRSAAGAEHHKPGIEKPPPPHPPPDH